MKIATAAAARNISSTPIETDKPIAKPVPLLTGCGEGCVVLSSVGNCNTCLAIIAISATLSSKLVLNSARQYSSLVSNS